jgi:predicted phosphoribosyltransferase
MTQGNDTGTIIESSELRDRRYVFRDRAHAGAVLSDMLASYRDSDAIVVTIPAGGVPVGVAMARELTILLDVAVVSKITPPWNTEVGYGAVSFQGAVRLNEPLVARLDLTEEQIRDGIERTQTKVERRERELRGERPFPDVSRRPAILVDDGLASGFTMRVAVESLERLGATRILVAVPTGHDHAVETISREVEAVYCANVRGGYRFAVADAYQRWSDVGEEELQRYLQSAL